MTGFSLIEQQSLVIAALQPKELCLHRQSSQIYFSVPTVAVGDQSNSAPATRLDVESVFGNLLEPHRFRNDSSLDLTSSPADS